MQCVRNNESKKYIFVAPLTHIIKYFTLKLHKYIKARMSIPHEVCNPLNKMFLLEKDAT